MVIKLSGFAGIFTFSTPAPVVPDWPIYTVGLCNVILDIRSYDVMRNRVGRQIVQKICQAKNCIFQFFVMNVPFISSRVVRKSLSHSWFATNEIMHFSLHSMK